MDTTKYLRVQNAKHGWYEGIFFDEIFAYVVIMLTIKSILEVEA